MIKGILVDWGGVMMHDWLDLMVDYHSEHLGVSHGDFEKALEKHHLEFMLGDTDESTFYQNMYDELGITVTVHPSWGEIFEKFYMENTGMYDLLKSVKANHPEITVGLLSNTEIPAVNFFRKSTPFIYDSTTFSCEENLAKPEVALYHIALSRMCLPSHEVAYFDDDLAYSRAAHEAGITNSFLFRHVDEAKQNLRSLDLKVE